jgi:NUMOD3 motif
MGRKKVQMSAQKTFFTYLWLRANRSPYYVGKTCRINRACGGGRHSVNAPPRDRILILRFPTNEEAVIAEKLLIKFYGRKNIGTGILRNMTDGGEGCLGLKQSPETIAKRTMKTKGKRRTNAMKEKIRKACRARVHPSALAKGEAHWNRGLIRSDETRQKIREKRNLQDMSGRVKLFCKRGHRRTPLTLSKNKSCLICKNLLRKKEKGQ